MPRQAVVTATALSAAVATLLMALLANLPLALAPGMGINAFFAYDYTDPDFLAHVRPSRRSWLESLKCERCFR